MLIKRIGELEHIMANLIQDNKHMEERLDSYEARLYTLENLDIPQHVSKSVDEIVTDAVDWAIQAPLWNCFRDLPEADMKEILHQQMWETNSYKAHEDHIILCEALEKSMNRDHTDELLKIWLKHAERRKRDVIHQKHHMGLHLFLHHQQVYLELQDLLECLDHQKCHLHLHPPIRKQDWWKPLEENRPVTSEPAWSIPSSDLPTGDMAMFMDWFCKRQGITKLKPQDLEGPAFELVKTGDTAMFMDWFCKRQGITKLKPQDLEGPAFELVKVIHPNMWIKEEYKYDIATIAVRTHMRILSVVRIEVFSMFGYDYMKKIVLRRADLNEHIIVERDFKYLYLSDFEDLGYKYHPLHVISYPLDQICADLSYVEEPEAILDRQDRVMRNKTILFVKILWRNHPERETTWETEESIRTSYPHFIP
nr:hypothetical protein [Tanacetum cinerariifolium]